MTKTTFAFISIALLLLSSCSRIRQPTPLTGDKAAYIGTWLDKQIPAEGWTDNTVLAINPDSSGLYYHCKDYSHSSRDGGSSEEHTYNGAQGYVTSIQNNEIVLSSSSPQLGISLNYTLKTRGSPYQVQNDWFIDVEGKTLRKLRQDEQSDHKSWRCLKTEA